MAKKKISNKTSPWSADADRETTPPATRFMLLATSVILPLIVGTIISLAFFFATLCLTHRFTGPAVATWVLLFFMGLTVLWTVVNCIGAWRENSRTQRFLPPPKARRK